MEKVVHVISLQGAAKMKDVLKLVGVLFGVILVVFILTFFANSLGLVSLSFFAPKVEQVRYNTFKESQAFNEGTIRELYNYQRDYNKGNDEQKAALKGMILHEFSTFPKEKLPADLQLFYSQVSSQ